MAWIVALVCAAFAGSCVIGQGGAPAAGLTPQPFGWRSPKWMACPADVPTAERGHCALVEVPLDWDHPEGPQIAVLVRRFVPPGELRGQLWALDGGPGKSGDGFTEGWFLETVMRSGFELLVPTHRGAAYSTPLRCPSATTLERCVYELGTQWGEGLRHFDTHMAAQDVVALARGYPPPPSGEALVFGGSYGTVWLQRILQAEPDAFSGAYLDSAGDLGMNFERIGEWFEVAGRELLALCSRDPACASHFDGSPQAAADRVQAAAAAGTDCSLTLGLDLETLQHTLTTLLQGHGHRTLVAPLIRRLERCSEADQIALRTAFGGGQSAPPGRTAGSRDNLLLNLVATYRELYRVTMELGDVEELAAGLLFDNGAMRAHAHRRALFPKDFARPLDTAPSRYVGPLHVVQGALDPLTPLHLAEAVVSRWVDAATDLVVVAQGGHASPRFTIRRDGERCSERWLRGFLADPTAAFDGTCLQAIAPLDLGVVQSATQDLSQAFFGVRDAWGE